MSASSPSTLALPVLHAVKPSDLAAELRASRHDALVVVGPSPASRANGLPPSLAEALAQAEKADATLVAERPTAGLVLTPEAPGGRVVVATTGSLAPWELDVRVFGAAATAGVSRALAAGARRPLVVCHGAGNDARFARAAETAALAALASFWEPLEVRASGDRPPRADALGVVVEGGDEVLARVAVLERARIVARDICGTEPESMAPEGMARYCEAAFAGTVVRVEVNRDQAAIAKGYPLIAAVARASQPVERHRPRIIKLSYEGEGPITRTILLAGKGITYDTGGADLKTDGHMAGMSRDKGGAAAVAGLLRAVAETKPRGVRVIGLLGAVRNSIGSDSFVTDEIIRSRAGVRVRIGNTDAEGRLVLADLLAALRDENDGGGATTLLSIATLTGHAALAVGPYTALLENGVAKEQRLADAVQRAGDAIGDPIERSTIRPEDYAFVVGKSVAEDVLSCNSLPSSRTPRGHQFPAAFLDVVSGLRAHNAKSTNPAAYMHVDIAGAALVNGNWQTGTPTGAPILALLGGLGLTG